MLKKYILISAILISSTAVLAYQPVDSIGVENNNGKKLIIHKVDPKESYYSIARRYNVNVKSLQDYNNNTGLQIGTILKVPTELPFMEQKAASRAVATPGAFFEYTVAPKDNLRMIAERYATTIDELKRLNNLTSINLSIGQILKVPFTKTSTPTQRVVTQTQTTQTIVAPVINTNATTIEHIVKPKEYLGIIAKQYGVTVEDLKNLNALSTINLRIGQVLKIPSNSVTTADTNSPIKTVTEVTTIATTPANKPDGRPIETTKTEVKTVEITKPLSKPLETVKPIVKPAEQIKAEIKSDPSFEHVVTTGETIYSIAQRYQLTTYQIKTYNNLKTNDLKTGQKLIIKGEKPTIATTTISEMEEESGEESVTLKNLDLKRPAAVYGLNRIEEKGTAVWIVDQDLDPSKMLILHRVAPVGTIIQVTNPMTNRSTFAKVVGKFTENETTKDVIIVMTKAVADAVGALDKRFFCNIAYGPKDNEK